MRVDIRHLIILISLDHPAASAAAYIGVPTDTYRSWMRRGKGHRDYLMPHHVSDSGEVYTCCRISHLLSVTCDIFRYLSVRPYLLEDSTRLSDQWDQIQVEDLFNSLTGDAGPNVGQDDNGTTNKNVDDALDLLTGDAGQDAGQDASDQDAADALDLLLNDPDVLFAGSMTDFLQSIEDDDIPW